MSSPVHVRSLATVLVAAAILVTLGCATTIPSTDSTPPDVRLTVGGLGENFTLTSTSADESRTIAAGPTVIMLAVAADDQGVKNLAISGSMTISCSSDDIGQTRFAHYSASNPDPDAEAGPGDRPGTGASPAWRSTPPTLPVCAVTDSASMEPVAASGRAARTSTAAPPPRPTSA